MKNKQAAGNIMIGWDELYEALSEALGEEPANLEVDAFSENVEKYVRNHLSDLANAFAVSSPAVANRTIMKKVIEEHFPKE